VAQTPSEWSKSLDRLYDRERTASAKPPLPKSVSKSSPQLLLKRIQSSPGAQIWLVGSSATVLLLVWDWKLLCSTSAGVLGMMAVYSMQQWDWRKLRSAVRQFLSGSHRQFSVAAIGGGVVAIGSYLACAVWTGTENHWIASGELLQSAGILSILGLLAGKTLLSQVNREEIDLDRAISHLTDIDPLQRSIAIHQITQLLRDRRVAKLEQRHIADYFRLMLSRESEPIVRDALLEGMQALQESKQLAAGMQPISIPKSHNRSPQQRPLSVDRHPSAIKKPVSPHHHL
jgi:hypothetical protein